MEKERLRGCVAAHITFDEFVDEVYWPQMVGPCANTKRGYECDLGLRILIALDNMEIEQIYKLNIDGMVFACPAQDAVLACWATPARWACYQLTLPRSAAPTLGGVTGPSWSAVSFAPLSPSAIVWGHLSSRCPVPASSAFAARLCEGLCKDEVPALAP